MKAQWTVALERASAVVLLLAASACGGGGESTERATSGDLAALDACLLITTDEIRTATGRETAAGVDPVAGLTGAAPMCAWVSADGTGVQVAQLLVSAGTPDSFEEYRDRMAQSQITITQIDGPGRYTVSIGEASMIQSIGDRFMVQVMVEPAEGTDHLAAATTLTRAALDRLE
ncbi:MAG: hypothetical protein AB7F99_02790 [Vicinamibacterales bacterium]